MSASALPDAQQRHWQRSRRLTAVLLIVWATVTFGGVYFGRELSGRFFGWPFGFWLAAQGALIVYVLLVAFYAVALNRLDRTHAADTARGG